MKFLRFYTKGFLIEKRYRQSLTPNPRHSEPNQCFFLTLLPQFLYCLSISSVVEGSTRTSSSYPQDIHYKVLLYPSHAQRYSFLQETRHYLAYTRVITPHGRAISNSPRVPTRHDTDKSRAPEIQLSQTNSPSPPTITPHSSHSPLIPAILPSHSFRPSFLPFSHHFFFPFAMPSYQSLASLFKRLIELAVISHRRKSPFFTFRSLFFPAGDNALDPFPVIPATRHLFQFQSLLFASIYYSSLASTPFFPSTSKCS